MGNSPDVIAVVFDFDDTLAQDSTTKLLRERGGIDAQRFWGEDVAKLVREGFDPALAWLNLVLENVGEDKPLGLLTNQDLRDFGATLDNDFFPGLPQLFDDLRALPGKVRDVTVEFYVVTGGLQEIVEGSQIIRKYFAAVYGSRLSGNGSEVLRRIRRAVTFTEKTRYLFEINKGIDATQSAKNPFLVNQSVDEAKRRVPFTNMIYVGDGLTDIPCFSLLKKMQGMGFGVFSPGEEEKAKRALNEFLKPDRVISMHAPRYGPQDELGSLLRAAVGSLVSGIVVRRGQAERS